MRKNGNILYETSWFWVRLSPFPPAVHDFLVYFAHSQLPSVNSLDFCYYFIPLYFFFSQFFQSLNDSDFNWIASIIYLFIGIDELVGGNNIEKPRKKTEHTNHWFILKISSDTHKTQFMWNSLLIKPERREVDKNQFVRFIHFHSMQNIRPTESTDEQPIDWKWKKKEKKNRLEITYQYFRTKLMETFLFTEIEWFF